MQPRLNCVGLAVSGRRKKLALTLDEMATRSQILGWDIDKRILSRIEVGSRRVSDNEVYYLAIILQCEIASLYPNREEMDRTYRRSNPAKRKR